MTLRRRLALAALSMGIALLAAEAGTRLLLVVQPGIARRPMAPFGRLATVEQREWLATQQHLLAGGESPHADIVFDPELGWTNVPGSVSPDGLAHIDSRGLRSTHEVAEERVPGVRRVLACGESFTFGLEVADEETWPAVLERTLPRTEVWNYGVSGYGTDQALLRMRREARGPVDALIVGLMIENIGRNVNRYRPLWSPAAMPAVKPRFVLRDGALELLPQPFATRAEFLAAVGSGEVLERLAQHEHWSASPLPAWLTHSACARLLSSRIAYAARELPRLWEDVEGEPFATTLAILRAFPALAHDLGTEHLLVLVFPTRESLGLVTRGAVPYWTTLLAALEASGIEVLDLHGPLGVAARERGGAESLFLLNHLSVDGNALVAEAVAEWLGRRP